MSKKVLENIAKKYDNVQKGVNKIMGKIILNEEIAIGVACGRYESNFETSGRLREMGMSDSDIRRATNLYFDDMKVL